VKQWERNITKNVQALQRRSIKRHHTYLWKMWLQDLKFNRAAVALRHKHLLKMSFRLWFEGKTDRKYGKSLHSRAFQLLFQRETARYFSAWKHEFLGRRRNASRFLTRTFHRSHLERIFLKWLRFTYDSNRILDAVTRMQAKIRGMRAREFAEDYRTDVIWAANKINAIVRCRLGKKELRRRKRMFRLKEYKNVLEPECEQMEIEDRMSHHLRFEWDCAVALQRVWRGKMARAFAYVSLSLFLPLSLSPSRRTQPSTYPTTHRYVVKQKAVIAEELRKKKESERAVRRAEKRKKKRNDLHEKEEAMARRVQCLWRTRASRRSFLDVIMTERRNRAAKMIQRNVRWLFFPSLSLSLSLTHTHTSTYSLTRPLTYPLIYRYGAELQDLKMHLDFD
jgi:hypothetical protein